jgi:hypothetical protein
VDQPDTEPVVVPNLYVVTVDQAFGLRDGFAVVTTNHFLRSREMPVNADGIRPIFRHRASFQSLQFAGRSLATADEGNGSSPTQSMQRNLRPPVLISLKCIGLRHFGQIGGGVFLGMVAHLGSGGSNTELSVTDGCQKAAR